MKGILSFEASAKNEICFTTATPQEGKIVADKLIVAINLEDPGRVELEGFVVAPSKGCSVAAIGLMDNDELRHLDR